METQNLNGFQSALQKMISISPRSGKGSNGIIAIQLQGENAMAYGANINHPNAKGRSTGLITILETKIIQKERMKMKQVISPPKITGR